MVDREIKRAIEACRSGSEDASLPEMSQLADAIENDVGTRELFERSQRCDAAIRTAFRDVPVPDGLTERLLDAVGQAESPPSDPPRPSPARLAAERDDKTAQPVVRRRSRQRWLHVSAASAAVVVLSLLTMLAVHLSRSPEPAANDRLRQEITAWTDQVIQQGWQTELSETRLNERPWDTGINASPRRWSEVKTRYDASTIAYDLAAPGEKSALLFCMRLKAQNSSLPKAPPLKPYAPTGRTCLGVWRRGDLVYVLAVEGSESRYRAFVGSSILIG